MNFAAIKLSLKQTKALRLLLAPVLALRRRAQQSKMQVENNVLDHLSRILGDEVAMNMEAFNGRFTAGTRTDLFRTIAVTGEYESELAMICKAHLAPDRDAIDIGANIGLYSVMMAKHLRGRKVVAIEPTPNALARLRRNIQTNAVHEQVIVFDGVASDKDGRAEIKTIVDKEEYSSMGGLTHAAVAGMRHEVLDVAAITIDTLAREHALDVGFIKIDVEGMEHVVLQGMENVLKKHRPAILAELSNPLLNANGSSSQAVVQFMEERGYRVTDPLHPGLRPGHRSFGDMLCLPL
ncbi:MAG: hypothetical protein JWR15_4174 [Prosthecobacter sp.]|nr:hypothetical protein [Prosthecobacter sp.]